MHLLLIKATLCHVLPIIPLLHHSRGVPAS